CRYAHHRREKALRDRFRETCVERIVEMRVLTAYDRDGGGCGRVLCEHPFNRRPTIAVDLAIRVSVEIVQRDRQCAHLRHDGSLYDLEWNGRAGGGLGHGAAQLLPCARKP